MSDLFDIANLITTVGVDATKIKPEPGLPEKSSNEILTELFSTFDVPEDDDDEDDDSDSSSEEKSSKQDAQQLVPGVNVKVEKDDDNKDEGKRKKVKKKHKHKHESKDREKKHRHKKKSKHDSSDSSSDMENSGSKKKKKKKKSKRRHDSESTKTSDTDEPSLKIRKLDEDKTSAEKNEKLKLNGPETIKVKEEKVDFINKPKISDMKEKSPSLPPISKRLNDDVEAPEVPKLLEISKNPPTCKIMIKDLKNSEVFNNTVKEIESKQKEKAERLEDGEIIDSDNEAEPESNRTPTLSPTPPPDSHSSGGLRSDRKKYSKSPSNLRITKKNDLRLVLKEKEKQKHYSSSRSNSKSDNKRNSKKTDRSSSCQSRDRRTRSRSGDRSRGRGRSRERHSGHSRRGSGRHSRDDGKHKSRSEDRNRHKWRGRSRSKERKERIEIDKKKLLEIARRNAINMIKKGKLPLAQQDKAIAAIQAGGKTIDELTDFCKTLSRSEAMGELSSISSGDESGSEKGFHHPFLLKERPSSIIMNIRDAKQLPTKTLLEKTTEAKNQLRIQYPVSSGQQHRKNENEWVPVPPKPKHPKPEPKKLFVPAKEILQPPQLPLVIPPLQTQVMQPPVQPILPAQGDIAMQQPILDMQQMQSMQQINSMQPMQPMQPINADPMQPIDPTQPIPPMEQSSIFPAAPSQSIDISAIVSQRLSAMRKLSENPNDSQALNEMHQAQSGMKTWIESKQTPGQFTGTTGAKVLSAAELNSGHQAWARKDQLLTAQPVSGGMGMALLQKMGWKPGEGLGKNKEGTLEPLQLEVKLDKKGLVSDQDIGAHKFGKAPKPHAVKPFVPLPAKSLEGKHPVSLLGEFCSKRKFGAPTYELCFECGPDHKKNFLFKVKVNGMEYQPSVASPNKKLAKAEAAQICLQALGILP